MTLLSLEDHNPVGSVTVEFVLAREGGEKFEKSLSTNLRAQSSLLLLFRYEELGILSICPYEEGPMTSRCGSGGSGSGTGIALGGAGAGAGGALAGFFFMHTTNTNEYTLINQSN